MTNTYEQAREALRSIHWHACQHTVNWTVFADLANKALAALDAAQGQPPPDVAGLVKEAREFLDNRRAMSHYTSHKLIGRLASALEASSDRKEQPDPTPGQPDTTPQGGPALTDEPSHHLARAIEALKPRIAPYYWPILDAAVNGNAAPSDDYIRRVIDRFLRFYVHTDPPERVMMTLREAMTEVKP
jgi:hypothetical protein